MDIALVVDHLRSLVTLASFVTFVGICLWSWSGRRNAAFAEAAALPFADDDAPGSEAIEGKAS